MSDNRDPLERALELLVYAPIGAGLYLAEIAPPIVETVVARGRAEFDRRQADVQRHVVSARSLGQVAIAFGVPKLRERVDEMLGRRGDPASDGPAPQTYAGSEGLSPPRAPAATPASAPAPAPVPTPTPVPSALAAVASNADANADAPVSEELPIPGYDALSASQVVERLTGLGRAELDAVHAYEAAHRHRRTILGKIEQLAG